MGDCPGNAVGIWMGFAHSLPDWRDFARLVLCRDARRQTARDHGAESFGIAG